METQASYATKPNHHTPSKAEIMNSKLMAALNELGDYTRLAEEAVTASSKEAFLGTLQIAETLQRLMQTNDEIHHKIREKINRTEDVNRARRDIEEIKALKIVSGEIVGKNEAERNASMLIALQNDAEYITTRRSLEDHEAAIMLLDADIEHLRGVSAALRYQARLIAAQLEYLSE